MEKKLQKNISYRLKFIVSGRFMASLFSNIANNLSEGIHKINLNWNTMIENVKLAELNINIVAVFLNTQDLKMI